MRKVTCLFAVVMVLIWNCFAWSNSGAPVSSAAATRPGGGFDASKCGAMVRDLKVWDPVGTATLENYLCGGFIATQGPSDLRANPPKVHDGKGILCRIRTVKAGDVVTLRNCGGWDIDRENKLVVNPGAPAQWIGTHTDFLFIVSDKAATGLTLRIIDCYVGHVEGETIHIEGGSFASIELVRVTTKNFRDGKPVAGNKVTVKLQPGCKIGRVVADGCDTNLYFDTTRLNGADPGSVVGSVYIHKHTGTFPKTLGSAKMVINDLPADMKPAAPVAPAPGVPAAPATKPTTIPVPKPAPSTLPTTVPIEQRTLIINGKRYRVMDELP